MLSVLSLIIGLHPRFWSRFPPDVDPINFAAALREYSISADSPHPPGYPLFVSAAKWMEPVVGAQSAYQAVNLFMVVGMCACLYIALRKLGLASMGLASASILGLHPLTWSATVIQESYISDAFFACLLLMVGALAGRSKLLYAALMLPVFFGIGLIRPVSGALLLPLAVALPAVLQERDQQPSPGLGWIGAYRRVLLSPAPVLVAAAGAAATGAAWLFTADYAGGIDVYRANVARVMGEAARQVSVFAGGSPSSHLAMLVKLYAWLIVLAAPAMVATLVLTRLRFSAAGLVSSRWFILMCLAWIGPALAFYSTVYYLKPSYQLIYLPCLCAIAAWGLVRACGERTVLAGGIGAVLALSQLMFFVAGPSSLPAPLRRLTAGYVAARDSAWDQFLAGLDGLPREGSLLVWDSPPELHLYGLKLIEQRGRMSLLDAERDELVYFSHSPMVWHDDLADRSVIGPEWLRVIHIHGESGKVAVRSIELPPGASRSVREIFSDQ